MAEKKNRSGKPISDSGKDSRAELEFRPVTTKTWADFEELLGPRGGWGGCWCMWWRLDRGTFEKNKGERNKQALRRIVASHFRGQHHCHHLALRPHFKLLRLSLILRLRVHRRIGANG